MGAVVMAIKIPLRLSLDSDGDEATAAGSDGDEATTTAGDWSGSDGGRL